MFNSFSFGGAFSAITKSRFITAFFTVNVIRSVDSFKGVIHENNN